MQYTTHYNLNLPEGSDIVNPLIQDNPNYSAIDAAMYANKLRGIGTATELTSGTVHAITRNDTDIPVFRFIATSDYNYGDTFSVDGVTVSAFLTDGRPLSDKCYIINASVLCILDETRLTVYVNRGTISADNVSYDNTASGLTSNNVQNAIDEIVSATMLGRVRVTGDGVKTYQDLLNDLFNSADRNKITPNAKLKIRYDVFDIIYLNPSNNIAFSTYTFNISNGKTTGSFINIQSSNSMYYIQAGDNVPPTDNSAAIVPAGYNFDLYY